MSIYIVEWCSQLLGGKKQVTGRKRKEGGRGIRKTERMEEGNRTKERIQEPERKKQMSGIH
jgi:hypothetical protein